MSILLYIIYNYNNEAKYKSDREEATLLHTTSKAVLFYTVENEEKGHK